MDLKEKTIYDIMFGNIPDGLYPLLENISLTTEDKRRIIFYWFTNDVQFMIKNYFLDFLDNDYDNILNTDAKIRGSRSL